MVSLDVLVEFYGSIMDPGHGAPDPTLRNDLDRALSSAADLKRQLGAIAKDTRGTIGSPPAHKHRRLPPSADELAVVVERALDSFHKDGTFSALTTLWRTSAVQDAPIYLEELATEFGKRDCEAALELFLMSFLLNPTRERATRMAARAFKYGSLSWAEAFLKEGEDDGVRSPGFGELRLAVHLRDHGARIAPRAPAPGGGAACDVAYVVSSCQPWAVAGYTTRSHFILSALIDRGLRAVCYARPGYPWDRPQHIEAAGRAVEAQVTLDQVPYRHTPVLGIETEPEAILDRMAAALVQRFEIERPAIIQAASNSRNALPALMAARQLGIPFIYEVRGLWELTTASKMPGWERTERFALQQELEAIVAREADLVFAITGGVADELTRMGVDPARIRLLPNGVDPDSFQPAPRDEALMARLGIPADAFILVYAGALAVFEGLDDVIAAVGILKQRGILCRLIIAGDGAYRSHLEQLVRSSGLDQEVLFVGRVAPTEVPGYISLADVVPIVRKPFRVCEVVSPLKPFEAMAMEKLVIVSDLPTLTEIIVDNERGRVCRAADPQDLARVLEELANSPDDRLRLAQAGRAWVLEHRTWDAHAARLISTYAELGK